MVNLHDADDRLRLMRSACFAAVREHFSHLAVRDIVDPPHGLFDALLARQVAITLMRDEFCVPRRRIATLLDRQRTRISFIMRTIDQRRECPVFEIAYQRMADRARVIFNREVRKAQVAA